MGIDVIYIMRQFSKTKQGGGFILTEHAADQMCARRVNRDAVEKALKYGRVEFNRGAKIYAIGRKEVKYFKERNIDLIPYEGVQVVVSPEDEIITVYRNRSFRGLKPDKRHPRKPFHKMRYANVRA